MSNLIHLSNRTYIYYFHCRFLTFKTKYHTSFGRAIFLVLRNRVWYSISPDLETEKPLNVRKETSLSLELSKNLIYLKNQFKRAKVCERSHSSLHQLSEIDSASRKVLLKVLKRSALQQNRFDFEKKNPTLFLVFQSCWKTFSGVTSLNFVAETRDIFTSRSTFKSLNQKEVVGEPFKALEIKKCWN